MFKRAAASVSDAVVAARPDLKAKIVVNSARVGQSVQAYTAA